jgi:cellulose synthase/poly-beta-1,6-N-acetylglucosamine synthase-like glycosyltransferase
VKAKTGEEATVICTLRHSVSVHLKKRTDTNSSTTNRGFPAAVNQGLSVARGEYLVLLNNDAVVTDSWLEQLIALANAESGLNKEAEEVQEGGNQTEGTTNQTNLTNRKSTIGLVGSMSNYASPPQLVEGVASRDMEEMQGFARRWRDEHRGLWFTTGKLSGFCLLVKHSVSVHLRHSVSVHLKNRTDTNSSS